jgi:tetratricopeptide (TPR) repeat protein
LVTATPEGGETYAEVAHEAIFRRWNKLRDWVESQREFLTWKSSLDDDRRRWEDAPATSKNDALLLGLALGQAQAWLVQRAEDLSRTDRQFIDLSQKGEAHRREVGRQLEIQRARAEEEVARLKAEGEAQEQRERAAREELARLQAEQETQQQRDRAAAEKVVRKRRLLMAGLVMLLVSSLTLYFFNQKSQQALLATNQARFATSIAKSNFVFAVTSAQKLLNQVSISRAHGDLSLNGANDMLRVANGIVEQTRSIENSIETAGLLIHLQHSFSDVYAELGNTSLAYQNARKAKEVAEQLRTADPSNSEVPQLLYSSLWRMGDAISYEAGDLATQERALRDYLEAQAVASRLAAQAPGDGARQRELMFIGLKIGDVQQALGDFDAAAATYRSALNVIEKVVASVPKNRNWRRDAASARRRVGQALAAQGDFGGALEELNAALAILIDLAAEDLTDNIVQFNLATSHRDIASVYAQLLDLGHASAEFQLAIAIQENLIAKDRDNATWQSSLASSQAGLYAGMGDILRRQGDLPGALDEYRKAYTLRQGLAGKDSTNPSRQNSLAKAAMAVADVLVALKDNLDEAMNLYRQAIEIQDEVRPRHDDDVFDCYIKIGDIRLSQNDHENALTEYTRAWAIASDIGVDNASSAKWQRNLIISYVKIGDLLLTEERATEAREHYERALEIVTALAEKNSKSDEWPTLAESLKAKIQTIHPKP